MPSVKVLLIDADETSRNYVAATLRKSGYEILIAPTAKEGLVAAWSGRPAMIVADPVLPDLPGEELAAKLRAHPATSKIPLVALSSDLQSARRRSCLEAGFTSFFFKSPKVMSALAENLAEVLRTGVTERKEGGGALVVFLSAKGGTGTSSLCANLAMCMADAQREARLVVADLVLPIGSIAGIVGYEGEQNVVSVARLPASQTTAEFLRSALPRMQEWKFHLLAGSPDPERANALDVARIDDLVGTLQDAFDITVADLGRSLSRISLPLIERADLIVMIVSSDVSTVALTKTVWEYLRQKGVNNRGVYVILNRAVGLEGLTKTDAEKVIGLPINATLPYLAENVSLANNQHVPFCTKYPGGTASIILKEAARQMLDLVRMLHPA